MCDLVVARTNGVAARHTIRKGTVLCADDPRAKGREKLFLPLRVQHYCGDVEQATAAPGEKRDIGLYPCDHPGCSSTAKSPAGLAAHKRSHNGDSE